MALLLTAPYDPWKQTQWASELVSVGAKIREQREARQQQQAQQALADQRRAFEFDRRLEFERARTAADDVRADSLFGLKLREFNDDHAKFTIPDGAAGSVDTGSPGAPLPTGSASIPASPGSPSMALPSLAEPAGPPAGTISTPTQSLAPNADSYFPQTPAAAPAAPGDNSPVLIPPGEKTDGIPGLVRLPAADAGGKLAYGQEGSAAPSAALPALPTVDQGPTGAAGDVAANPLINGTVPTNAKPSQSASPSSQIELLARQLQRYGIDKKPAEAAIVNSLVAQTRTAAAAATAKPLVRNFADGSTQQYNHETGSWDILAQKKSAPAQSMAEAVGDATPNPAHNTYVRPDGTEFFLNRGANGNWTQRAFKPDVKPAKTLWGNDGNVYHFDAQGNPLGPVPDGVKLRDHAALNTVKTPGGGTMIVDPDGSTRPLIPDGLHIDAKTQDKYVEAAGAVRAAQVELDTQTKLRQENPSKVGVTWFGGGTDAAVNEAKKKLDAATQTVESLRKDFPQLQPHNMPSARPAPQPTPAPAADPIAAARAAIAQGKDRTAVIQRLRDNGIDPSGL